MLLKFYDVNLTFGIHGESFTFIMLKENNGWSFIFCILLSVVGLRVYVQQFSYIQLLGTEVHFIGFSLERKTSNIV